MRLRSGARVAVIGAGPGGLAAAKHAIEAGFDTTVFEAADDLGGQRNAGAAHSGIWPGMHANTSRAMTAFSDFPAAPDGPLHPAATEVHAYLRAYAERFGVAERIRFGAPVRGLAAGWRVDGEPFDGVVLASGRFRRPHLPPGLGAFEGELLHAFGYPGAEAFRGRRTLVLGNGISGLEIAADLADGCGAEVLSAFRKSRYVIQKVVDGVSSDWQWYALFGVLERRSLPPAELGRVLRERVVGVAGDPASFGAPAPHPDLLVAGIALCQGYLPAVADGRIACRPGIASVEGRTVTFTDGTSDTVDAIVCATGYELELPYLGAELRRALTHPAGGLALHGRTLHPDLPGLGVVGQFALQGPYFPVLELQARWIVAGFTGEASPPDAARMRAAIAQPPPPLDAHHVLATALAEELGVAPDPLSRPELAEPLVLGPLLPPRYRLDGPGARTDAPERFGEQLAASPRAPVDPAAPDALRAWGFDELARLVEPASAR